ncbi:hypothetical protein M422DRAFT_270318, partial [Sphaerobolus stellatus SS14]
MDDIAPVTEVNRFWLPRPAPSPFLPVLAFFDMLIVRRVLRRKQPNTDSDGEWISHAMKAAKITAEAAKMIPVAGPFIEGGANIFCVILEPLQ